VQLSEHPRPADRSTRHGRFDSTTLFARYCPLKRHPRSGGVSRLTSHLGPGNCPKWLDSQISMDNITHFIEYIYRAMVPGETGGRSLALWEKRVILVAQEDFSGWKSAGRSVKRQLVTLVPNRQLMISGGGQGCHTSLTTSSKFATCSGLHLSIDRTGGISRLATLIGSIRPLQEVSCRTGAAVNRARGEGWPSQASARMSPARRQQNESRACACPRAISRTIDVAHEVFEKFRDQRTT
jgi:hypothetical protein